MAARIDAKTVGIILPATGGADAVLLIANAPADDLTIAALGNGWPLSEITPNACLPWKFSGRPDDAG